MFRLSDSTGKILPYRLIQYLFRGKEHEVSVSLLHGNSKKRVVYRHLQASVRNKIKVLASDDKSNARKSLDNVFCSEGDVTSARSLGQLPRGPKDFYNIRYALSQQREKERIGQGYTSFDKLWMLLDRAKRENEISKESCFIRECDIHPELFIFLATDRQLNTMAQFTTDPPQFCVLGIDPTFNIFKENLSLTVTAYRNVRLIIMILESHQSLLVL